MSACITLLDIAVGFTSVDYTVAESDKNVSVCVVHEGARAERPFSVALLTGDGTVQFFLSSMY